MFPMLELINFAGYNTLFLGALSLVCVAVLLKGNAKGGINFASKGARFWPFIGSLHPWLGSGFDQVFSQIVPTQKSKDT